MRSWTGQGFLLERVYAEWRQAEAIVAAGGDREEAAMLIGRAATTAAGSGAVGVLEPVTAFARGARLPLPDAAAPARRALSGGGARSCG